MSLFGGRQTRQREVIREILMDSGRPLSVEEIHELASRRCHGLGMATVYRTIKLLHETDLIERVRLSDGVIRYEPAGLDHHHHFKCRVCARVFDLNHCLFSLPPGARLPTGFVIESHSITLYGLCAACAKGET